MAQEKQPFRGFARQNAASADDRGAALLDTAAVRAARVAHFGGPTASTELPVVSAEAAAAILNAATPITSSLPRVEVAAPAAEGAKDRAPAITPASAPVALSGDAAVPGADQSAEVEPSETIVIEPDQAEQAKTPQLEADLQSEETVEIDEPDAVSADERVAAGEPVRASRHTSPVTGATGQVSAPAGDFEAFAATSLASAPPVARTPLGVDPELSDDPAAGEPDLEPDVPAATGAGAQPQPAAPRQPVDESVVILEEPVLIAGGEIIRPRTMHAPAPQPAPTSGLNPNPDARDDLSRAADPSVAGQELMGLATHRRAAVRAAVAARPDLPATVVVFLSRDHSSEVLTSLLRNPRVPASTVRYLADHRDPRVADLAVQRLRNDFR